MARGWTVEEIMNIPKKGKRRRRKFHKLYEYKGNTYTINELSELSNISKRVLQRRMNTWHWTIKEAVETPLSRIRKKENKNETR